MMFRPIGDGGKGDAPRPTDWNKFSNNFDIIFGKKDDTRATTKGEEKAGEGNQGEGKK
jgi:hypothetical protein